MHKIGPRMEPVLFTITQCLSLQNDTFNIPLKLPNGDFIPRIAKLVPIFKMVKMHSHAYSIELKFGTKLVSVCVSMHWWKCTCIPLCASIFYFESCNKFTLGHVPVAVVFLGR